MNGTDGPVDFTDWQFVDGAGNHNLALAFGAIIIPSGGFAVIAEDAAQFLLDFPDYAQILFDSSFSLNNSGETLGIRNAEGTIVDEVTYSSSQGGSEDGNSLQLAGEAWIAGIPTPGAVAPTP